MKRICLYWLCLTCVSVPAFGQFVHHASVSSASESRRLDNLEYEVAVIREDISEIKRLLKTDRGDAGSADKRSDSEYPEPDFKPIDTRAVVQMFSPATWACISCETWEKMDQTKLPFRIEFLKQDGFPYYPRFRIGRTDGWTQDYHQVSGIDQLIFTWKQEGAASVTETPDPYTESLGPDAQPTPWSEVRSTLNQMKIKPSNTIVDIGCGYDARFSIEAARVYGCRAVAIEIDPGRAKSARKHVKAAGLSDRVTVIEGDASRVDWNADVGVAFMWPDALEELKPKIQKLDRFASLHHKVPGLSMEKSGPAWIWKKTSPSAVFSNSNDPVVAEWGGVEYRESQVLGYLRGCGSCNMCGSLRKQRDSFWRGRR